MADTKSPSLSRIEAAALAAVRRRGPICVVCRQPADVRHVIVRLYRQGVSARAIAEGLRVEGIVMKHDRIGAHFRDRHEEMLAGEQATKRAS